MVTAVKKAFDRDSLIVRLMNYGETEAQGRLRFCFPGCAIREAYETDLDENRLHKLTTEDNTLPIRLRRAGLMTLEIVPAWE